MRKLLVLAGAAVTAAALTAPASAGTHCYTVHAGPFPTTEQCVNLPIDPGTLVR